MFYSKLSFQKILKALTFSCTLKRYEFSQVFILKRREKENNKEKNLLFLPLPPIPPSSPHLPHSLKTRRMEEGEGRDGVWGGFDVSWLSHPSVCSRSGCASSGLSGAAKEWLSICRSSLWLRPQGSRTGQGRFELPACWASCGQRRSGACLVVVVLTTSQNFSVLPVSVSRKRELTHLRHFPCYWPRP